MTPLPFDPHSCLLIIDASGLLYRSFYGVRSLLSPQGEPTGALYGFIRSLTKALVDLQPSAVATVFDGKNNKASRLSIYREYKAHRKPTPPELIQQIDDAKRFCHTANLHYFDIEGVEADDTIASITRVILDENRALSKALPIVILSADKDLMQLVQEGVYIMNPMKENLLIGEKEAIETWNILPSQIRDYLAIVGDSSDNIPGIAGLGPKAALHLLKSWNTLPEIYDHIDEIGEKEKKKLIDGRALGEISRILITLNDRVAVPTGAKAYSRNDSFMPEKTPSEELILLYKEKGFKTLLNSLIAEKQLKISPKIEPQTSCNISIIDSKDSFTKLLLWLSLQKKGVAIDTETTSLDEHTAELVGMGIASSHTDLFYIDFTHSDLNPHESVASLSALIEKESIPIIGHNAKYDLHILKRYGFSLSSLYFDTLVASWVLCPEERTHSLDSLSLRLFDKQKIPIEALIGKKERKVAQKSMREVPVDQISRYCCEDVEYTLRLQEHFENRLEAYPLLKNLFHNVEMALIPILFNMEERGIFLNKEKIASLKSTVDELLAKAQQQVWNLAGEECNISSPKQVANILYTKLQIPPIKKGKTSFSTDAEVLEELAISWPIASAILEYRQLEKLRSTYIDLLPTFIRKETGRIHCRFLQSGTATGRLSCQDPNLQNIPVRSELGSAIREAFEPQKPDWSFISFDYSQIELRILAHMSQDPTLMEAFQSDQDVHAITAKEIFHVDLKDVTAEMRRKAKAVNFGVIYGQRGFGLSKELHIPLKEANQFIEAYFARYQTVQKTIEILKEKAHRNGYAETITGRIRPLPEIHSSNQMVRAAQERLAVNTPFQGTGADIIKMAMIQIEKKLRQGDFQTQLMLQIHDELLFEAPDSEIETVIPIIQKEMETILPLSVPMKVHVAIGKNWKEC
ncbi:MAG: DNA polymerase I [Chlamydia sp.]